LEIEDSMKWELFPFDVQHLHIMVAPTDTSSVDMALKKCSAELLKGELASYCNELTSDSKSMGVVPASVAAKKWPVLWRLYEVHIHNDPTKIDLEVGVARDPLTFMVRIIIPSMFLVIVSWAGFFISPKALMPRFASGFISFLALNTFKTNAMALMPAAAGQITWIDCYMSCITFIVVFAVIENIYAQFVNERTAESCAELIDDFSRKVFPLTFFFMVAVMLTCASLFDQVIILFIIIHAIVIVFAITFISVAVWDKKTHHRRLLRKEMRRIAALIHHAHIDHHAKLVTDCTFRAVELQSFFKALDDDGSGVVDIHETRPWIIHHLGIEDPGKERTERELQAIGVKCDDIRMKEFAPFLTKAMGFLVHNHCMNLQGTKEGKIEEAQQISVSALEHGIDC
jgi:hypothetical protein